MHTLDPSHADAEARRSVLTALPCATLVTALFLRQAFSEAAFDERLDLVGEGNPCTLNLNLKP